MKHCQGKEQHARSVAVKIAKAMRRRRKTPVQAYRCPECGCWHVGNRVGN